MRDCIEIYHNVLSKKETDKLIRHFEEDPHRRQKRGSTNGGVDGMKESTDITHNFYDESELSSNIIRPHLVDCATRYSKKYEKTGLDCVNEFFVSPLYNIQRYKPGEGYHQKHCECAGLGIEMDRILVWMIYLNDVHSGGRTIFPTQGKKIRPRRGTVVIWPAYWMWPHYGETSKIETKYVATGWFTFNT